MRAWHHWVGLLVTVAVLSAQVLVAAAQDLPPDHPPIEATATAVPERPSAASAEPVYMQSCAPCHGETGGGDGPSAAGLPVPPTAFSDPTTLRGLSPQQIFDVIRRGRLERGMPPWENRLSPQVMWDLVAYLFDLNLSPEEYEAGRTIYQQACAACHGPSGRGDGPDALTLDVPDLTRWPDWVDVSNQEWQARVAASPVHQDAVRGLSSADLGKAIAYVRTLGYSSTHAPLTGNGVLRGEVVMMTPGVEADFTGLELTLFGFRGSMTPQLVMTTTVQPDGTFTFSGLSTEPDVLYSVATTWEGANYSTGALGFPPGQEVITTTLAVAAATDVNPGIRAERVHWFIDFEQGRVVVGELVSLTNPGDRAYIGEPIPELDGKRAVVRWPLPPGAQDVAVDGGGLGERFFVVEGALVDTLPLPPGVDTRRLLFRYVLPVTGRALTLEHPLSMPVRFLNVFVADRGQRVRVPDFLVQGSVQNVGDVPFRSYMAADLAAGSTVTLRFENIPANPAARTGMGMAPFPVTRVAGGVLAVLFAAGLMAGLFYLGRGRESAGAHARWQVRRDALLREVAALDAAYEAGQLDEATYRRERDLRMMEAVRLTLLIEGKREG